MKYLIQQSCLGWLGLCFFCLCLNASAWAVPDTLRYLYSDSSDIAGAEATTGLHPSLDDLDAARQSQAVQHSPFLIAPSLSLPTPHPSKIQKFKANLHKTTKPGKQKRHKKTKVRSQKMKDTKKKSAWHWAFHFKLPKLLDLDWLLVILAIALPALLIAGLYILLGGMALSFFEALLFALGFGFAVFAFIFVFSEWDSYYAAYIYFIKYGLGTWPGIFAILAGFAGLFELGGTFGGFFLVGLIVGLVSFIISLLAKDTFWMP